MHEPDKFKYCKFWRYIIDSGKTSILEFDKFKYFRCLSLQTDSGNFLNPIPSKCNTLT
ncbi:hypothetical protein HanXRQr2_Chr01g0043781 [Helianthus annuus]|uniref:Uncharacterized protein n=1 Tax=Helianthus annuus TaxID=4232 RepID=A0A9K3K034_HELAN|nr:hypothetical protein HanXRQr2_Chr01g0043781 [Helianthus annuus]KAJ0958840.1 hypothetical protein HanPSC8_Chr01g0043341 [Helianthus annuus]